MVNLLLVIDLQNDFITGSLGSDTAQALVPKIYNKIKHYDGNICGTLDTHYEDYLTTQEGIKLPVPHCIVDTFGWEMQTDIARIIRCKGKNEDFYIKNTFGSVELACDLTDTYHDGNVHIEIIGLLTDICVISNALILKAFMPNSTIVVDASCCAGTSYQAHKEALAIMRNCHIDIINS